MNLGKITKNCKTESKSVTIAKKILESSDNIKTYFGENDKRVNLDGQLTILYQDYERITVDVQIKALPSTYINNEKYHYDCDTKVFNVVIKKVTQNPVVLLLVDINSEKLYSLLISPTLIDDLNIGSQKTKRIEFSEQDIFDELSFIESIYKQVCIIETDVPLIVMDDVIRTVLKKRKKPLEATFELVYSRKNIKGYLTSYWHFNSEKKHNIILLKMTDGTGEEIVQVHIDPTFIQVNRSLQRTTSSDSDLVNILYTFVSIYKKHLLYTSAGNPAFYINQDKDIWVLQSQRLAKEW